MGLNEYRVLEQVWQGNIHAPQIAQATNFHPQLVKACLISLERAHILEYKDGYKPARAKVKPEKKPIKRAKYDRPATDMVIDYLRDNPGKSNEQISMALGVNQPNVRVILGRLQRYGTVRAEKGAAACTKVYYLNEGK
jgi:DNA-binding IclR family transcriptional regulator